MSDKPTGGLVTILIIAPLLALCCLGPIVFASMGAGFFAWIGGFDPLRSALMATLVAIAAFYFFRWRKRRKIEAAEMKKTYDD